MASPTVSYMRSLSFAPHHSHSAWAAAAVSTSVNAAARSQQLYLSTHSINSHNTHIYTHHLHNFNSHHDRSYSHHLQHFHLQSAGMVGYSSESASPIMTATATPTMGRTRPASFANPSPSGAGGRRRSSSIRSRNPPPFIKFDPFADEPSGPEKSLSSALAAQPTSNNSAAATTTPYTIEIPPAGPTETQRYGARSPHGSPRRFSFPANNTVGGSFGGGDIHSPVESRATILPALSRTPTPLVPSPSLRSSPSPPPPARQPLSSGPGALGGPNVSKLVAGILLNRMSVGKPMRRRVPSFDRKEYVRSSLSSVVSVEA